MSHPDNYPEIRMCGTEYHPAKKAISNTPETDALIPSQSFVDQTRLFDREYFIPLLDKSRSLETRLRQAEADLVKAREDAERYRHMRGSAAFQDKNGPGLYWYLPRLDQDLPVGERLDAAIDRARGKP